MNNINNKGLTIIELLVCFVIVAVIAVSLLSTIMDFKNKEQVENIRSIVLSYKNVVTKVIQTDIINNELISYSSSEGTDNGLPTWNVVLNFRKPFENSEYSKTLKVVMGDNNNYIVYPDVVKTSSGGYQMQAVKYDLYSTASVYDDDKKYNDIRFVKHTLSNDPNTFKLDIEIHHSELSNNYHINIVAPLGI